MCFIALIDILFFNLHLCDILYIFSFSLINLVICKIRMTTRNKVQQRNKNNPTFSRANSLEENKNALTQLSKKLKNPYLLTLFEETKEKEVYRCKICPKGPTFVYKNIKRHILESETHERNLESKDLIKHEELLQKLGETKRTNKTETQDKEKSSSNQYMKHKRGYLKFAAACYSSKLSFQQIQEIGLILKEIYLENDIGFLGKFNFSLDELSQMANCWGEYLKEEIIEDLKKSKYTLCLDTSTITGTNVLALQLRYLKDIKSTDNSIELSHLEIQNRVIGLKYLGESSTGETIYNTVNDKLFSLSPQIKDNLIGLAHDHGSNLSGHGIGLVGRLKADFKEQEFFNLEDPCHSLDLSLYGTLEELEDEVLDFVEKIHLHFLSPQRKALLSRIQKEDNFPNLGLKRYVSTRWLSLGISLKRLIQIWPSLIKYMQQPLSLSIKKKEKEKLLNLLKDKYFKLKAIFLSNIIEKINNTNIHFQNQSLEIDQLPLIMNKIIKEIAELVLKISMIPEDISLLCDLNWKDDEAFLRDNDNLLDTLARELNNEMFLEVAQLEDETIKTDLIATFRNFLQLLLKKLLSYLPVQDKVVKSLSFLSFNENKDELKSKIIYFNKLFNIIPEQDEKFIIQEINELLSKNITWMRRDSTGSSLRLWSLFEQTYGKTNPETKFHETSFPCLSKIVRTAHSLAPSSANVEQCFSVLKLLKTALRSSLKEKTLESLVLIHDEFKTGKPITIPNELIAKYDKMKEKLNQGKNLLRISNIDYQDTRLNEGNEEIQNNIMNEEELKDEGQEDNKSKDQDMSNISELLEKSCIMESEEEKYEKSNEKKRLEKKSKYSAMLKSLNDSTETVTSIKLKKMKLE